MKQLHWPKHPLPGNFGDLISPYLYKKITGFCPTWCSNQAKNKVLMCGSLAQYIREGDDILGTGIIRKDTLVSPKAKYHFVRGPLTRDCIVSQGGECSEIYCDPGLLLPYFYKPKVEKKHKIGIIPHYVDYESVRQEYSALRVINILNGNIELVINQILECDKIVSSSLHGVIVAHAYGVPACWKRFSSKLCGDDSKFEDYAQSIGIKLNPESKDYMYLSQVHTLKAMAILEDFLHEGHAS